MSDQRPDQIDYRNPTTPDAKLDPIVLRMVQRQALTSAGAYGLLVAGVGIILLAGAIVSTLICFILYSLAGSTWIGWWGWFFAFLLLMVPLLFWEERRSKGDYLTDRAGDFSPAVSSHGEFELQRFQMGTAVVTDMLLWGPRGILKSVATLRGENAMEHAHRFERAARIIRQLLQSESGIQAAALVVPSEDVAALQSTLRWLDDHDYIGISSDRKRVWLSTEAREAMQDLRQRVTP